MTKKLEILVVEDTQKHLDDAKATVERFQKEGMAITVDYATTLDEALKMHEAKQYDATISDVFYPIETKNEQKIRNELYKTLKFGKKLENQDKTLKTEIDITERLKIWKLGDKKENFVISSGKEVAPKDVEWLFDDDIDRIPIYEKEIEETKRYIDGLKSGTELAPAGVYLAKRLLKEKRSVVLCSDLEGHGIHADPVVDFAYDKRIPRFGMIYEAGVKVGKDWQGAIGYVIDTFGKK